MWEGAKELEVECVQFLAEFELSFLISSFHTLGLVLVVVSRWKHYYAEINNHNSHSPTSFTRVCSPHAG